MPSIPSAAGFPAVLLVPGWSDTARTMGRCHDFLVESGWPRSHVRRVDFADRFGSNVEHAQEIAAAMRALGAAAPRARRAVVAHSMGGLALRYFLTTAHADAVHTAIFVGTPHAGTFAAYLAWGRGGREMRPNSEFLRTLNATPLPPRLRAHSIRTPIDTRVLPGTSAWLEGTQCHMVRAPTHPRMMRHPGTLRLIRDLLLA